MINREHRAVFSGQLQQRRQVGRGRPRLAPGEVTVPITVNVPASVFDTLAREAARHGMDLAPFVRRKLQEFPSEK